MSKDWWHHRYTWWFSQPWRCSSFAWEEFWQRQQETRRCKTPCCGCNKLKICKLKWMCRVTWLRSWSRSADFNPQKYQLMIKSQNWRRLIRNLVELLILHGFAFVELSSCSCILDLPCRRQEAAEQRMPPTFWWKLLLAFALEPWVGGVWAGHLLMARRMAMASLERTASSVPTSTLETQALEWLHLWNAPLMAASRLRWVGSSSGWLDEHFFFGRWFSEF